ncbi:HTH cro/C1-type domain-containing protein [Fusobacterium necrophorum subsp. funduliforme]|uniref:helix-turn-helix domain-containing protein n=1 Tax=Fusobacterium necrophorum TaxID=859 RepID=UPI000245D9C0|nr:helix-turn-helix transcriptional regulator [Fusobacterium necrophorum]EHO21208.1 hypothetical protein HMPREF9466_00716 [Fusobacterium necrophorum subsp. funduliforme 1_1_36S]AVQ20686.1 XRE family transcriptional regulator [Fusobacterium necrophorum subsp. funduliforme]AYV94367.1 XRE family transcriptional regulator [Fusobacterium necrophorum subsp. funduliforme]KYL04284.1 hypothetical protein A2J06_01380 [Fusobacterium necrophorum subsp. funduliforme]KYM51119.1 hypothetical protein A2U04_01
MRGKKDTANENNKKLGKLIDELRQERGLGFNQLSQKSGVNVKSLNEIMYGKAKRINPIYLIQLANSLGIHYKEFYKIIGYLNPEDDIVKKEETNMNFIGNDVGDGNIIVGGSIESSTVSSKNVNQENFTSENFLDLSKLSEQDAQSIRNIYDSLIKNKE